MGADTIATTVGLGGFLGIAGAGLGLMCYKRVPPNRALVVYGRNLSLTITCNFDVLTCITCKCCYICIFFSSRRIYI